MQQPLTPAQIRKMAPAIVRLPTQLAKNLVDTTVFLSHVETQGFRPVAAFQGKPHADAQSETQGRHLAVTANRRGAVIAILNSHTVWRRAWIGLGWTCGESTETPNFMLGVVLPLQRWKGFEEPLDSLMGYSRTMSEARDALRAWPVTLTERRWMARKFAASAYLPKHKTPAPKELTVTAECPAEFVLMSMLQRVRAGGLQSAVPADHFPKPRKLKPVLSPDGLFNAANAAARVGFAALNKYRGSQYAFPQFSNADAKN